MALGSVRPGRTQLSQKGAQAWNFLSKLTPEICSPCTSAGSFLPCTALWWSWGAIAASHCPLSPVSMSQLTLEGGGLSCCCPLP